MCEHKEFRSSVAVERQEVDGKVKSFRAKVKVWCVQCGKQFKFQGGADEGVLDMQPGTVEEQLDLKYYLATGQWN